MILKNVLQVATYEKKGGSKQDFLPESVKFHGYVA